MRTSSLARQTLALVALMAFGAGAASAQPKAERIGESEYMSSCAPCHGATGKGDGPVAPHLNVRPSDLTQITRRNNGDFPFYKLFQLVDGRAIGDVHGTRAMPIWGNRYSAEAGDRYGPYGGETIIRGRIYELVRFLEAIQE